MLRAVVDDGGSSVDDDNTLAIDSVVVDGDNQSPFDCRCCSCIPFLLTNAGAKADVTDVSVAATIHNNVHNDITISANFWIGFLSFSDLSQNQIQIYVFVCKIKSSISGISIYVVV
jgi:hypothetical protein